MNTNHETINIQNYLSNENTIPIERSYDDVEKNATKTETRRKIGKNALSKNLEMKKSQSEIMSYVEKFFDKEKFTTVSPNSRDAIDFMGYLNKKDDEDDNHNMAVIGSAGSYPILLELKHEYQTLNTIVEGQSFDEASDSLENLEKAIIDYKKKGLVVEKATIGYPIQQNTGENTMSIITSKGMRSIIKKYNNTSDVSLSGYNNEYARKNEGVALIAKIDETGHGVSTYLNGNNLQQIKRNQTNEA